MKTAPREAGPGRPTHLPLHRVTLRWEREPETLEEHIHGADPEERTALGYYLGLVNGHHVWWLAEKDGTPRSKVWAAEPEEVVSDVPAGNQPARVPPAVEREIERLFEVRAEPRRSRAGGGRDGS